MASVGVHSKGSDWNKNNCVRYGPSDGLEFWRTKWLANTIIRHMRGLGHSSVEEAGR